MITPGTLKKHITKKHVRVTTLHFVIRNIIKHIIHVSSQVQVTRAYFQSSKCERRLLKMVICTFFQDTQGKPPIFYVYSIIIFAGRLYAISLVPSPCSVAKLQIRRCHAM